MSLPANPESLDSVTWVPLGPENTTELFVLLAELEDQDQALFRTSLHEAHEMLGEPETSKAVGAYLSTGEPGGANPGVLIAFGYIGLARSGNPEAICHGGVHRKFRGFGLGESVMRWQTEQGEGFLRQAFPGKESRIVHTVDARREDLHGHLTTLGYYWQESYAELRHDLEQIPDAPDLPAYLDVLPWDEQWERPTKRAFKRAAKEMDDHDISDVGRWAALRQESVADWSFVAVDRSGDRAKVVGLLELGKYEQDWAALGWKEGYIDTVAVFEPNGRLAILGALVSAAMKSIAENGLTKVAVGLDPQAEPDMMKFYEELGFKQHVWWRTYARDVVDPAMEQGAGEG